MCREEKRRHTPTMLAAETTIKLEPKTRKRDLINAGAGIRLGQESKAMQVCAVKRLIKEGWGTPLIGEISTATP